MDKEAVENLKLQVEESLSNSDAIWWEWEIQENRVTFNPKKVTHIGYNAGEFEGSGYEAFTSLLHPQDYERTMEAMTGYLEGKLPAYQIDYRIKRADGNYTWYIDRGYAVESKPDGKPARIRGLVFDLGVERETGQYEESIVEAIRSALPEIRGDGRVSLATVCSVCLRLKLPDRKWVRISDELPEFVIGQVSHGLCPRCLKRLYPDLADRFLNES